VPAGSLSDSAVPAGIRAVEVADVPRAIEAMGRLAGGRSSGAPAVGSV
jgi:DNA repair protein RadA/Sms